MNLGISIINYQTVELTKKCLESILSQQWHNKIEIWVLDNASGDGSAEKLRHDFPQINLVVSEKNLGFAGGHNLIIPRIKTDMVLILNSDTEILPNSLDKMVAFMEETKCGVLSAKLIDFNGNLQPNSGDFPFGAALLNWLFNLETFGFKEPNFHRNEPEYYQNPHPVDWVSGGCMMVKREVFDKIGFFNEDYFMYFEDVEFCFRASHRGFTTMLYPEVSCKHLSGGSSDNPQLRQWLGELVNLVKFYRKNFGQGSAIMLKMIIYCATTLRMLTFLFLGKIEIAKTYAKVIKSI